MEKKPKRNEKRLAYEKEWRNKNPDKVKSYRDKYAAANRQYMSDRQRKYHLRNKYGITEQDYNVLLEEQQGLCAICGTDAPTGKWKRFAVDHCHNTGKIRGLLCNECNRGMGLLKDSIQLLQKAVEYLERNNESIQRF